MMGEMSDRFYYVYSCDLDVNLQIKIGTLEGERQRPDYKDLLEDPMLKFSGAYGEGCSDLYVTCQVFADEHPLSLCMSTSYKAFSTRWNWNEWLTLPVKYSDLPRNAVLCLTVWDIYGTNKSIPVGSTTIPLFGKRGTYRQGMHDLKVWPNTLPDPNVNSTTPGKTKDHKDQMSKLAKLSKKHRDGHMLKVDWLDRLTFREIEMINEKQKRDSKFMYLMIEFPFIHYDETEYTVVYFEKDGDEPFVFKTVADLVQVPDPEIDMENLVESKHHKLARSLRSGPTDRDMKPDAKTRNLLNEIVRYPPTKTLTSEEEDLVWKFRFYLCNQKKALTKFLKCVNWKLPQESRQGIELLTRWSPMDVEDALELLSPAFTHPSVRKYAVSRLRQADDQDLLLYLLQLVQALKYEDSEEIMRHNDIVSERRDSTNDPGATDKTRTTSVLSRASSNESILDALSGSSPSQSESPESKLESEMDLASFLISRACNNSSLANYFYWYLSVECVDPNGLDIKDSKVTKMYQHVLKRFSQALFKESPESRQRRSMIARQQTFIDRLVDLVKTVMRESGNRKKKIERLQALLHDPEACKFDFSNFEPLSLPLDPDVKVCGIAPEKATLFKSNLMPCKFVFKIVDGGEYVTIFKHGDDLRQDNLILQIITLMNRVIWHYSSIVVANLICICIKELSIGFFKLLLVSVISAGYCVITYLLGVGDRHFDNLLLTKTGKLFHIDFGYILGRDPKLLPPLMKLTTEMIDGMGGPNSEHFHDFKKLCYTAFLAIRRSSNLILNLFTLMISSNIPDIAIEPDKTVKKVQDKFVLHLTDEEAVQYMQNVIDGSVSAMMPVLVERFHTIAQKWRK
ncbi:phosphatidylinositol 3-kinase catalytic subunit type 3-like [Saccostrea cucullata]|uniref:phosphatidylinositol 3-kinase catalytic subunit type 3-like n=1 Tax=Saccostrea cuccullata TaxID=36930 RepID=UPI002ED440CE